MNTDTLIVVSLNGEPVATCTEGADLAECVAFLRRNPRNVVTFVRRPSAVATALVEDAAAAHTARRDAEKQAREIECHDRWTWGHTPFGTRYANLARTLATLATL